MRAPRLDPDLHDAKLPVKRRGRHDRNRPSRPNVGLHGGHGDHALSVVRVATDGNVDGGPLTRVANAHRQIRFCDLRVVYDQWCASWTGRESSENG